MKLKTFLIKLIPHISLIIVSTFSLAHAKSQLEPQQHEIVKEEKVKPLYRNKHIKQWKSLVQRHYEEPGYRPKHELLENESKLCGIFAAFNACCMLDALNNPEDKNFHLARMQDPEAFNNWINPNKLEDLKAEHGKAGNLYGKQIMTLIPDEYKNTIQYKCYCFIKNEKKENYKTKYFQEIAQFFKKLYNRHLKYNKPFALVFNTIRDKQNKDGHWIAIAFHNGKTWIADSAFNNKKTEDERVLHLDYLIQNISA